jgi:hypothetical protein
MKKIFLMLIVSAIFVSCNAPTEVKIVELSPGKVDIGATFTDFFDPVELVHANSDNTSTAIVMDKNTGILYVRKSSGYQWGHVTNLRFGWYNYNQRKVACKAR